MKVNFTMDDLEVSISNLLDDKPILADWIFYSVLRQKVKRIQCELQKIEYKLNSDFRNAAERWDFFDQKQRKQHNNLIKKHNNLIKENNKVVNVLNGGGRPEKYFVDDIKSKLGFEQKLKATGLRWIPVANDDED